MFIAALFTIAKKVEITQKSIDRRVDKEDVVQDSWSRWKCR